MTLNNVSHNNAEEENHDGERARSSSLYVHTNKQQRAGAVRGEFAPGGVGAFVLKEGEPRWGGRRKEGA